MPNRFSTCLALALALPFFCTAASAQAQALVAPSGVVIVPAGSPMVPSGPAADRPYASLSDAQLGDARGSAWAEIAGGVVMILAGPLVFGGASVGLGIASENHGIVCRASPISSSGGCTPREGVIGNDTGLLAGSLIMAGLSLVSMFVGGFALIHPARHHIRSLDDELDYRAPTSSLDLSGSSTHAVATWTLTF